jgi:hypothetical protein
MKICGKKCVLSAFPILCLSSAPKEALCPLSQSLQRLELWPRVSPGSCEHSEQGGGPSSPFLNTNVPIPDNILVTIEADRCERQEKYKKCENEMAWANCQNEMASRHRQARVRRTLALGCQLV